jgi:flagellar basal-body rod protein FlgB
MNIGVILPFIKLDACMNNIPPAKETHMDLSQLGLMNGITSKMSWLVQRQSLIAENVSNADTPDYRAKDLVPFSFKNTLKKLMPTKTDSNHISLVSTGDTKEALDRGEFEIKPDGNGVSREHQSMKGAQTAADYQLVTNIYQKTVGLLKMAVSSGS